MTVISRNGDGDGDSNGVNVVRRHALPSAVSDAVTALSDHGVSVTGEVRRIQFINLINIKYVTPQLSVCHV